MKKITTKAKYDEAVFPDVHNTDPTISTVLIKKLEMIHDIRKFEIELYWKRTTYYWGFLITIFGSFGLTYSISNFDYLYQLRSMIIFIGFLISYGWILVNRGSKFWQENWEKHLDLYEKYTIGNLYSITLNNRNSFLKIWKSYPFSVSKINIFISLFITIVWISLYLINFNRCYLLFSIITTFIVLVLAVTMTILSKTKFGDSEISFTLNETKLKH